MRRYCWAAAWLAVWAAPALAHVDAGQSTGFLSGLLHPVSGLDHVLAMVAVGLWGALYRLVGDTPPARQPRDARPASPPLP